METVTKEFQVFPYEELDSKAQSKAFDNWVENQEWHWGGEAVASLKAFEKVFPIYVWNYCITDDYRADIKWKFGSFIEAAMEDEITGVRLATYIWNNYKDEIYSKKFYWSGKPGKPSRHSKFQIEAKNCPLTGVCYDNSLLDPIWKFLQKPCDRTTFEDLINECFESFLSYCRGDIEYTYSEERFLEDIQEQELKFLENGTEFNY